MKKAMRVFAVMLIAVLMFTMIPAAPALAATPGVKVTFNANGGKFAAGVKKSVTVNKGKKVGKLPKVTRTGYSLKGWYTKKSGGTKVASTMKVNKKATYYAQWTVKQYTLSFNANGGNVTTASRKVAFNSGYGDLPTATRSGYTMTGWYTAKTGGTKVGTTAKMPAKNVTIYAQWKKGESAVPESTIVDHWRYRGVKGGGAYWYYYDFTFNKDGTFLYSYTADSRSNQTTYTEGKYSVSGGKVYLTTIVYEKGQAWQSSYPDRVHEFKLGKDTLGDYLMIGSMNLVDESGKYVDIGQAVDFRRYQDIYGS